MTKRETDSRSVSRRNFVGLGVATAAAAVIPAAHAAEAAAAEEWPIWPRLPPGAPLQLPEEQIIERSPSGPLRDRIAVHVRRPILTVFRPRRPNGGAVLIIPGGGFVRVAIDKEGYETGQWLSERGITAFVLRYRMPGDGWLDRAHVPLQDAARAIRLIRAGAARWSIDPARLAVLGFSAGGHVAAMLSVSPDVARYEAVDDADRLSARPNLAGLVYAALEVASPRSPSELLGASPSADLIASLSPERQVSASTPPTILFHAGDDATVPVDSSLRMYGALRNGAVAAELHVFEEGGHGFGLRLPSAVSASRWPDLFALFAGRHRLLG